MPKTRKYGLEPSQPIRSEDDLLSGRTVAAIAATALTLSAIGLGIHYKKGDSDSGARSARQTEALAMMRAGEISDELYTAQGFKAGVPVPGILNGSVVIKTPHFKAVRYNHPIILTYGNTGPGSEGTLDGAWVGIPTRDAGGRIGIAPELLQLGKQGVTTEFIRQSKTDQNIASQPVVYVTQVEGGDQLMAGEADATAASVAVPIEFTGSK